MKILLNDWAARNYSPAPSAWVLRKWVRAGEIQPAPERVGAAYYVDEAATRRVLPLEPLLNRLRQHLETA
jgi:predicted site-specific integrase-resolvase